MNCIRRTAGLYSRESAPPAPPLTLLRPLLTLLLMALLPAHGWDRAALVKAGRAQIGVTTGYGPQLPRPGLPGRRRAVPDRRLHRRANPRPARPGHRPTTARPRGHARPFLPVPAALGPEGPRPQHRPPAGAESPGVLPAPRPEPGAEPTTSDYEAGDIVSWNLADGRPHIGIISDRKAEDGTPLVIHNIGAGVKEENVLWDFKITGHYRPAVKVKKEKKADRAH